MSDIVTIGDATLYHGDCLEILPTLDKVDAVVTDPPYGINAVLGMGGGYKGSGGMWKGQTIAGDMDTSVRDAALNGFAFAASGSLKMPPPPDTKAWVVWDKGAHTGAGDLQMPWKPSAEMFFVGGDGWHSEKRIGGVIRINAVAGCVGSANDGRRAHPFEKPVRLMEHFVCRAPDGVILDPFMGSGTTGVACANLGRKFIGIEIERKYFDIACERIDAAYAQGRLFV